MAEENKGAENQAGEPQGTDWKAMARMWQSRARR